MANQLSAPSQNEPARARNHIAGWASAAAVVLCLLLIHPVVDIGVCDDWSYILSAQKLAETGHILYNGWATAILGPQLLIGALFFKLFGGTFTAVRLSTMAVAALSAPLAHAVLVRFGIRTWNATVGTLALVLSPLFLALGSTFMSDTFAMFFFLSFLYCAVRCTTADRSAILWLCLAAASGLIGGSIRQIIWLAPLVALPALAWHQRARSRLFWSGAAAWLVSALLIVLSIHWFHRQPYISVETLYTRPRNWAGVMLLYRNMVRGLASCLLLLWPILTGITARFLPGRRQRTKVFAVCLVTCAAVLAATLRHGGAWWGTWLLGDFVTTGGVLFLHEIRGMRPTLIPPLLQAIIVACVLCSTIVTAWVLWNGPRTAAKGNVPAWLQSSFVCIAGPFTIAYLALVYTRSFSYDRYYLPLLFLATVALLRWCERNGGKRLAPLSLAPLILLAVYAVTGVHDQFAALRARSAAIQELLAAGVPRTEFSAGFEYDGITQVQQTGFVNEPRLSPPSAYIKRYLSPALYFATPSDAYPWRKSPFIEDTMCYNWFFPYTLSIHPRYQLSSDPHFCFTDAPLPPVQYRTWLPPHQHAIYFEAMPPAW